MICYQYIGHRRGELLTSKLYQDQLPRTGKTVTMRVPSNSEIDSWIRELKTLRDYQNNKTKFTGWDARNSLGAFKLLIDDIDNVIYQCKVDQYETNLRKQIPNQVFYRQIIEAESKTKLMHYEQLFENLIEIAKNRKPMHNFRDMHMYDSDGTARIKFHIPPRTPEEIKNFDKANEKFKYRPLGSNPEPPAIKPPAPPNPPKP